jgi:hypothetical protein
MRVNAFSKSRSDQQVAPVGFRKAHRIFKPVDLAATQLEGGKAEAVHSTGIEVPKERQVISAFFEEDLAGEFLIRWTEEQNDTAFGFGTELGSSHALLSSLGSNRLELLNAQRRMVASGRRRRKARDPLP